MFKFLKYKGVRYAANRNLWRKLCISLQYSAVHHI